MLLDLHIENFALIDKMDLSIPLGFTVLTGETGAGKSIIIDALNLALGGRANDEYIRTGTEESLIQVCFHLPSYSTRKKWFKERGYPEETEILLSRHLSIDGRNKSYINGKRATLGEMKELGSMLMEIHGQNQHQSLLNRDNHLQFLDLFSGEKVIEEGRKVQEIFSRLKELQQKWILFSKEETERLRQIDLLTFQKKELEEANLDPLEEEELRSQKKKLAGAARLKEEATLSYHLLEGEGEIGESILSSLGHITSLIGGLRGIDGDLEEIHNLLDGSYLQLKEASYLLFDYLERLQLHPRDLQEVEERLILISNLKRKYGPTIEAILDYEREISHRLQELEQGGVTQKSLERMLEKTKDEYFQIASRLSKMRREGAQRLKDEITASLMDLKMEKVQFSVDFKELQGPTGHGFDEVEFLISPNLGEELKPLALIASGGELSRIMLAFKTSLPHLQEIGTLIFDEIDTGVGGKTAHSIGEKMALLAMKHQVLSVTHLPQIAAMADHHFLIEKQIVGGRTSVNIKKLQDQERIEELARMLGAMELTTTSLSHAKELLSKAIEKKKHL